MKRFMRIALPLFAIVVIAFSVLSANGGGYEYSLFVRNTLTNWGTTVADVQTLTRSANISGTYLSLPAYGTGFYMTTADSMYADSITNGSSGQIIYFVAPDSDFVLKDGKNLQLNSDFSGTTGDVITLVYFGTKWKEMSRSAN